jgi:hypothetical protein
MNKPAVKLPNEVGARETGYLSLITVEPNRATLKFRCVACRHTVQDVTIDLDPVAVARDFAGECGFCGEHATATILRLEVAALQQAARSHNARQAESKVKGDNQ